LDGFLGFHSEWNLGSPGGWDYQRITQKIGKAVWERRFRRNPYAINFTLDFDHPVLYPVNGFVDMLREVHRMREGSKHGLIAVVAEEETLQDVVENLNLAKQLDSMDGFSGGLMPPQELEINNGHVCWRGSPVSVIFMDFNTDILLELHRKYDLRPLLQAVREGRVINPRGTEPINSKGMFEVITDPRNRGCFHSETIRRTPWTRQFYPRKAKGADGEDIPDLIEWTRKNWQRLVLKPERGYSGKGVRVGGIHDDIDDIIEKVLSDGDYIVQEKVPLSMWAEDVPELDFERHEIRLVRYQTDFRCLFGRERLFGFLGRYGGVPTNVGSGGGVQPLAVLRSQMSIGEATKRMNEAIMGMDFTDVMDAVDYQKGLAMENHFTYLLGPIKIALRPRLITIDQIRALEEYCRGIWSDCITMEGMWISGEIGVRVNIDPEELQIIRSQPWEGSHAIFAADGLFNFGGCIR